MQTWGVCVHVLPLPSRFGFILPHFNQIWLRIRNVNGCWICVDFKKKWMRQKRRAWRNKSSEGENQNIVLSIAWGKLSLSYRNIQSSLTSSLNHCLVANHSMDFLNILWRIILITAIKNIMWISTTCSCLYSQRGGVRKGWTKEVEYHCVELNKLYIT